MIQEQTTFKQKIYRQKKILFVSNRYLHKTVQYKRNKVNKVSKTKIFKKELRMDN